MGLIREPKNVDFTVLDKPWTEQERKEFSAFIKLRKEKRKKRQSQIRRQPVRKFLLNAEIRIAKAQPIVNNLSQNKRIHNCFLNKKLSEMKRDKAIDTVKELPEEFELEALIERLVFVEKVEEGLAQVKMGKTVSHDKAKELIKKW